MLKIFSHEHKSPKPTHTLPLNYLEKSTYIDIIITNFFIKGKKKKEKDKKKKREEEVEVEVEVVEVEEEVEVEG